ncbi:MAG: hypothetical protein SPL12_09165 [Bacteroidales bacterium]|nr:hypothetical protein [Bacteroidales bacterium]
MGFIGKFEMVTSQRGYNTRLWSFVLKCTNLMFNETVDCMISDSRGLQPFFFRNQQFKAGRSYRFDYDTVDWSWHKDDFFAILEKDDRIAQQWTLALKEYGLGECPQCHGSKRCRRCNGEGFVYPQGQIWAFQTCPECGGTGQCQVCDIPVRNGGFGGPPTGIGNGFR